MFILRKLFSELVLSRIYIDKQKKTVFSSGINKNFLKKLSFFN